MSSPAINNNILIDDLMEKYNRLKGKNLSLAKDIKQIKKEMSYIEKDKTDLFSANRHLHKANQELTARIRQLEGKHNLIILKKTA